MPDEADEDKYRYYVRDHQGSVLAMTDHEQNKEEYTYDSWGEHIDTDSLPSVANRIRYAGARVECFVTPGQETDAIYETGARHYWPMYGRFLQRDPLTYQKMPRPSNPFSVNPYIYAENNPVMKTDLSGLFPTGYFRGCTTPDNIFFLGTSRPPSSSIYDCCGNGFNEVSDDKVDELYFYHTGQGLVNIGKWKKKEHLEDVGLCELPYNRAQPNTSCSQTTYIPPDLCCTILTSCKGSTCPSPPPPPPPPPPDKKPDPILHPWKHPGEEREYWQRLWNIWGESKNWKLKSGLPIPYNVPPFWEPDFEVRFNATPYEWYGLYGLEDPTVQPTPFLEFETLSHVGPKAPPLVQFPKLAGPYVPKKSSPPLYTLPDDPGGD